jgi:hypothetical protein
MCDVFQEQTELHFIASSLLFVYDAANEDKWDLRLIDFAHVQFDQNTRDDGCITGLRSILSLFLSLER